MICCGKERVTNFCPTCGKPMNKEAGLLGLVRYLTVQLESAQKKATETQKVVDYYKQQMEASRDSTYYTQRLPEADKNNQTAQRRVEKWKDWQESLIKLVDGE